MILIKDKSITDLIKYYMGMISICLMALAFPGDVNAKADQVISDLKVLSLMIEKQTKAVLSTGSPEAIKALKHSRQEMNTLAETAYKKYEHQSDVSDMLGNIQRINKNIDSITQHQAELRAVYEYEILVSEAIPGIQAQYNLIVDQMARKNYSSISIIIARGQLYIGERILRSMNLLVMGDKFYSDNIDTVVADLDIFNEYQQALLNGDSKLGVARVNDIELRESLESIQQDMNKIKNSEALKFLKKREPLLSTYKAATDNMKRSVELFNALEKLD